MKDTTRLLTDPVAYLNLFFSTPPPSVTACLHAAASACGRTAPAPLPARQRHAAVVRGGTASLRTVLGAIRANAQRTAAGARSAARPPLGGALRRSWTKRLWL
jgi:hypothetical protein